MDYHSLYRAPVKHRKLLLRTASQNKRSYFKYFVLGIYWEYIYTKKNPLVTYLKFNFDWVMRGVKGWAITLLKLDILILRGTLQKKGKLGVSQEMIPKKFSSFLLWL